MKKELMIFIELIVDIAASAILILFGFLFGKFRKGKCRRKTHFRDA